MDPTRDILYRDFLLNDSSILDRIDADTGIGKGISGSVVNSWDDSDTDVVQFTQKKAQGDGMYAGRVDQGGRRLRMTGTLYGKTRGLLFDIYDEFRAALNPVLAMRDDPAAKGYQPIYFARPTNRADDYPDLAIPLRFLVLPRTKQAIWQRDQQGGTDADSLAISWQAVMVAIDPVQYATVPQEYDVSAGGTVTGNLVNRGSYLAPVQLLIEVGSAAGSIVVAAGGSTFTITVPASTHNRVIKYGNDRILIVEELSVPANRLDLISYAQANNYPLVPPGVSSYSVTFSGVTVVAGSVLRFWESFA